MEHHPDHERQPDLTRPPHAGGTVPAANKLTTLAHDLGNLLDGSMRQLSLARRSLDAEVSIADADDVDAARRHVDTAYVALERMCDLLHATLTGALGAAGSPTVSRGAPILLAEAADHAAAVVQPQAADADVRLQLSIDDQAGQTPAGAIYPFLLNGLRNAIEALARAGRGGAVRLAIGLDPHGPDDDDTHPQLLIEVTDDGPGLGEAPSPGRLFEPGVTSKRQGFGLGLAICAEVVRDMGGSVELGPAQGGGAVLRARYPVPRDAGGTVIG